MLPRRLAVSAAVAGALLVQAAGAARALPTRSARGKADSTQAASPPAGRPAVYLLWYGGWQDAQAVPFLTDFVSRLSGSKYFRAAGGASGELAYGGAFADAYSRGARLSDDDVREVVRSALEGGGLPSDPNGVYVVLASSDVDQGPGLCSSYCSWNRGDDAKAPGLRYAFVGEPSRCPSQCLTQARGLSGDAAADSMAAALAYELAGAVTGSAKSARCAWSFGATNPTLDGARYNVALGGGPYLLHSLWVEAAGGCGLSADVGAPPRRAGGAKAARAPAPSAGEAPRVATPSESAAPAESVEGPSVLDARVPAEIPGVPTAPARLDRGGPPALRALPVEPRKPGFFASIGRAVAGAYRGAVDAGKRAFSAATDVLGLGRKAARKAPQPALRGVNLGGWLVLERWMTDGLFQGTDADDEYSLSRAAGGPERIARHRRTFIVEEDFRWLRDHGVNAVRIPVGYWIFGDEPPFVSGLDRLDWAFAMAAKHGLHVLLDLHGAPGSQNGKDHSGRAGKADWYDDAAHREKTLRALERLQERYGRHPRLWGLELMNEPMPGVSVPRFWRLYWWTRAAVNSLGASGNHQLVFSDAYVPGLWSGRINHPRAVMDVHHYQCFQAQDKKKTIEQHEKAAAAMAGKIAGWQKRQPVVIGEWSLALEGKSLGVPHAEAERRFARAQLEAYKGAAGWFYWSYKTEGKGTWNFRSLVEAGVLDLR